MITKTTVWFLFKLTVIQFTVFILFERSPFWPACSRNINGGAGNKLKEPSLEAFITKYKCDIAFVSE